MHLKILDDFFGKKDFSHGIIAKRGKKYAIIVGQSSCFCS